MHRCIEAKLLALARSLGYFYLIFHYEISLPLTYLTLCSGDNRTVIDGWDCSFIADTSMIPPSENTMTPGRLSNHTVFTGDHFHNPMLRLPTFYSAYLISKVNTVFSNKKNVHLVS